jgi:L-iditol 2-dehydrogenase
MERVLLVAPHVVVIDEACPPQPELGEVLVQVDVVGICGSDIHAYHGRHPFISLPVIPGHEFAGTVVATGDGVDRDWIGRRVTAVPSLICGKCYNCRHGRYNICNELRVLGCQADGAMAELVRVPAAMLVELPDDMSFETGALVEPLAVAVGALHRAETVAGRRAVVFGAGTIGLLVTQVAKAHGAREVVVIEPQANRRNLALNLGADIAVDPTREDVVAWAHGKYGLDGIDLSFECVGVAATVNTAIRINRKGTRVIVVGVFEEDASIAMGLVQDREIELVGTLMYRKEHFDEAIWLLQSGKVQADPLITQRFPLTEAARAFAELTQDGSTAVKATLQL